MILDVNTIENGIDEYYEQIKDRVIIKRFTDRVPNELYRSMNYAIKYCQEHKIRIVNFIQDDYQYLYKIPGLVDNVLNLFKKNKRIGQIQTNMIWKRKSPGRYSVIQSGKTNYAVLEEKILVDTGFTRVKIYNKTGLYPQDVISYDQKSHKTFGFGKDRYKKNTNGELWFGKKTRQLGYKRAISLHPSMAMVFDCAYVRKWQRFGRYFPPPNKYYLKPLCKDKIKIIDSRHKKKKFTQIERYAEPDGWKPTTYDKHNRQKIKTDIRS